MARRRDAIFAVAWALLGYSAHTVEAGVTKQFARPPASRPLDQDAVRRLLSAKFGEHFGRSLADDNADAVSQVHLGLAGPGEVVVTFATKQWGLPSKVAYGAVGADASQEAVGEVAVYTTRICPNNGNLQHPSMSTNGGQPDLSDADLASVVDTAAIGLPQASLAYKKLNRPSDAWAALEDSCVKYKNPLAYYQSPYLHTVVLKGLEPGTTYVYRPTAGQRTFNFTMPPSPGDENDAKPLKVGVWGDVGTTGVSYSVMQEMVRMQPDIALLTGDYSYADGWSPIWEKFGVLMEPFMSSVPGLGVPGNHEIANGQYQGLDWMYRYPQPYRQSGSPSPMFYSYETGPVHFIGLAGSYAPTDNETAGNPSAQYQFAAQDLARVNRSRTPWIVVMFHTPMYCSSSSHFLEGIKHRWDMEDLFFRYGVDVVLNGHVHSYERSLPVYQDKPDACGTVHIVIGDAGNYEGPALPWIDPQPAWSAFREASFGGGLLTVYNGTHAEWEWRRTACGAASWKSGWGASFEADCATEGDDESFKYERTDKTWLVRDLASCPNKRAGNGFLV